MSVKRTILKWLGIAFWMSVTIGTSVLLVAAVRSRNARLSRDVEVSIQGPADGLFLDKQEILGLLTSIGGPLTGRPMEEMDLNKMEDSLRRMVWISDAQLHFTNGGKLQIDVTEREPIARIFTRTGISYYIDSTLIRLPLNHNYLTRKPVFTGFPSDQPVWRSADSLLMVQIRDMSRFILNDPFWMAQIDQVDLDENRQFTLVPKVGDQRILFGDGGDVASKFHRLMLFYREVLPKTGWMYYDTIHVGYKGQIVATRRHARGGYIDTAAARRNMEEMFRLQQVQAMKDTTSETNVTTTRLKEQL
jgi:cell division protein FtsQ